MKQRLDQLEKERVNLIDIAIQCKQAQVRLVVLIIELVMAFVYKCDCECC